MAHPSDTVSGQQTETAEKRASGANVGRNRSVEFGSSEGEKTEGSGDGAGADSGGHPIRFPVEQSFSAAIDGEERLKPVEGPVIGGPSASGGVEKFCSIGKCLRTCPFHTRCLDAKKRANVTKVKTFELR